MFKKNNFKKEYWTIYHALRKKNLKKLRRYDADVTLLDINSPTKQRAFFLKQIELLVEVVPKEELIEQLQGLNGKNEFITSVTYGILGSVMVSYLFCIADFGAGLTTDNIAVGTVFALLLLIMPSKIYNDIKKFNFFETKETELKLIREKLSY